MYNNKKTITPSEINKYVYCPYQWYYERKYGNTELRRLKREVVKNIGKEGVVNKRFQKGRKFHENYMFIYKLKRIATVLLILAIVCWLLLKQGWVYGL